MSKRTLLLRLSIVAFASASTGPHAAAAACPDGDSRVERVEVAVSIDPPAVAVDRDSVTIFVEPEADEPRRVCWVVTGLPTTWRLQIEPKSVEEIDPFPVLIRRLNASRTFANSGNPTEPTTWRYGLRLLSADGESLTFLDPEVIVKGRGG